MRFMVHEGSVTADTFYEFLTRLAAGMERKIYLVVDGHSGHKAGKVQNTSPPSAARSRYSSCHRTHPT